MPKKSFSEILASIGAFFSLLIGKFTWSTPPWINQSRDWMKARANVNPKKFWGIIAGSILFIALAIYGYVWYQSLPQPVRVIAQITPPKITPVEKVLVPHNLVIDFGIIANGELNPQSVAPLNLVGKEVTDGITMTPAMPGKWKWETDNELIFTPAMDWPAEQTYTIKFAKSAFIKGAKMASWRASFSTLPFEAAISEFRFYQDPVNPKTKQAVATISFSYPVDTHSFENKVTLAYQELKIGNQSLKPEPFKFTISYDEHKRNAWIRSEPMQLPRLERYLQLTLAKGVKPVAGPSIINEDTTAKILIPDTGSFFKVTKANASIIRNEQNRPEQVLTLETNPGVTQVELSKSLHLYALPQDYPATAAEETKLNYQWQDPGEVTEAILALAKPVELQAIPADRDYATLNSYKFKASTPGYLYLKLDKGTHAFGDYVLSRDYVTIIKVPEFPQEISFMHKGALMALGTEEKLSVLVRGLPAVKFTVARVLPDDVNHLITQTNGDFSNPTFIDYNFNQNNISEIFSEIQPFDSTDPSKEQYTALDLGKYLTTKTQVNSPLGLFLLQARGWDSNKKAPLDAQTSRLVLITDLGLIVKDNNNGTHDLFVQSIVNGTPVNGASVAILGKNGLPVVTRTTDAQGRASFPTLKDFTDDRQPVVYLVRHGSDISFIPYNREDRQLNYSRFDIGGITSNDQNTAALTAYIFADRGIFRPGDTAHIGMIVKQPYVVPAAAGVPLEAVITDPRGVTVDDVKMDLNDSGYLSFDFQTNATSQTGLYVVSLYIVKDKHPGTLIGSGNINVAEFLPDRMRITTHLSQEQAHGWVSPTGLQAKISLVNLYGAPAANHRISGRILLTPQAVTFTEFPDYTFIDPLIDPKSPPKVFTDKLNDTQTDSQGQAQIDLNLDRFDKATYKLTVFTEGFEAEGGRSVAASTSTLVSPLQYLVGYKADGDLNYIKQNAARGVHYIAVNPQLQEQALSGLKITIFKQHPITTLVKKDDGTYQYQSIIQTSELSSKPFVIDAKGTDFALATDQIGDFLVTVADQNGTQLSQLNYSVAGASQLPLPKNAELNVKLSKAEYLPGEDIEMQITAPYTGSGLITIERDKVYAVQWFKTTTTASVQKIHIPADFQGGGYVNIAFVRDINSPEIFVSPLSYSVNPFSVTHQNHEINIDLNTAATAMPGDVFTMTYKTDKPGKIIVFAVDEGILQVTKYQTPDPLKFFFQKRALEVNTLQIVDQILPKFMADRELSSVGGDAGEAAINKNLNPFKRRADAPVVFWSGIVDADTTPRSLTYQIPDYFNGSLRVIAIAVANDAVGATSKTSEVRGHFVINPNVPTFVAPSDEFDVSTSVANNVKDSGADAKTNVEMITSAQVEIIGDAKQKIIVPEGQERSVHFKLRAKSQPGGAELQFIASRDDKTSKMTSTLSVRPAIPFSTSINSGFSMDATKVLTLDRELYSDYRKVEASASPSPLILVNGLQNYLNEYPYGCVEQLVSKVMPLLAMANQPWFATDTAAITDKIQKTIQMLGQRQMSSGGFNYWPETGTTSSNDFASVYAMHFLTDAKAQGYNVPMDIFSAGIGFLKDLVTQDVTSLEQARIHAYAIYILTRNEIVTTNYLTNLQLTLDQHPDFNWHNDISSAYIAATYALLKDEANANKLIAYFKPQAVDNNTSYDFYNPAIANAQYLYLIARHFPDRLKNIDNKFVMSLVDALNTDTLSTVLSAYTSQALAAYAQFYSVPADVTLSISETMADGKHTALAYSNGMYQKVSIGDQAKQVTFTNPSKQGFFYQLVQAGFDKNMPKKAVNNGIEVYREYHGAENAIVNSTNMGDEIEVHIRARATDNQYHDNIALVDLLPGGFEVVRDSVKTQNMDYADVREDRVIFFGSVAPESKEIVYHIKATNAGTFVVPPMFGMSMYNPLIKSIGVADSMTVGS